MHPLFRPNRDESDSRSAFFAMASLMMILLPTLLMVTNPQKMVSVPLSLAAGQSEFTTLHTGPVEKVRILDTEPDTDQDTAQDSFTVEMWVRKSDVLASTGNTEIKTWTVDNWPSVEQRLQEIRQLDPEQQKIHILPSSKRSAQTVIHWLDSLQLQLGFQKVVVEHAQ